MVGMEDEAEEEEAEEVRAGEVELAEALADGMLMLLPLLVDECDCEALVLWECWEPELLVALLIVLRELAWLVWLMLSLTWLSSPSVWLSRFLTPFIKLFIPTVSDHSASHKGRAVGASGNRVTHRTSSARVGKVVGIGQRRRATTAGRAQATGDVSYNRRRSVLAAGY